MDDDARLASQAREGKSEALSQLLERYRQPLFALAVHTVGNREEALDVLQEACLRAMGHIAELSDPQLFYGWMRGIVRNLCLDKLRSRKRGEVKMEELARRQAARPDAPDSETLFDTVVAAIMSLPEEYHVPLFCRYVEEASYADIATRSGRTVDSVRGILYRGTRQLRAKLEKLMEL